MFADNRALWMDEAMVAISIRVRTFGELLGGLDHSQTMPVLLALLVKTLTSVLGHQEWVYRLPMLVASVTLLFVVWRQRGLLGLPVTLLALGLAATYRPLLYYGAELKQYAVDALVTGGLVFLTLRLLSGAGQKAWTMLAVSGVLGLLLSQPSVFVLAGVVMALLANRWIREDRFQARALAVMTSLWVVVFLLLYFLLYRQAAENAFMQRFWKDAFLLPGPGWAGRFSNAAWILSGAGEFPGLRVRIAAPLLLVGMIGLWRRLGWPALLLLGIPFAAMVGASLIGAYPISPRLALFSAPLLFWALAEAVYLIATRFPRPMAGAVGTALAAALVIPAGVSAVRFAVEPPQVETARSMIPRLGPDDPVIILYGGFFNWIWYDADWRDGRAILAATSRFYECITVEPMPAACDHLTFRFPLRPRTLLVTPPPTPDDAAVEAWADRYSARLLARPEPQAGVFVATYWDYLKPFRVTERLLERLEAKGARVLTPDSLGSSTLYRVALP